MKKLIVMLAAFVAISFSAKAQDAPKSSEKKFMQVTTVESVVAGGLGRSKMIITYADGSQKEIDMENLFSLIGINFKNIRQNEDRIIRTLKEFTSSGWKIEQVTSLTLSQNDSGAGGIFMTGYLLSKQE